MRRISFGKAYVFGLALAALSGASRGQVLAATPFASGLSSPIAIVQDPARRDVQYVVEQTGLIRVIKNGVMQVTPLLDLTTDVLFGGEQGLLGMAIPRDFGSSGFFYVNMTTAGPVMQVARFTLGTNDPLVADKASRLNIIRTPRQNDNHNGGTIQFGSDGMLYIGMGDGGGTGDQDNNAQNPNTLLGKMVRIDPKSDAFPTDPQRNYRIPSNNPFVDNTPITAMREIWAFGYRNPFKFSFDDPLLLGTGAMTVGDVGQGSYEEIDYEPAGSGGANYGWRRFEGFYQHGNTPLAYGPDTKPAYVYGRGSGSTVIGGRVYRGLELGSDYFGRYFFGDFGSGRVWSMVFFFDEALGRWRARDLREHTGTIGSPAIGSLASIDVDAAGEIILVDYNGKASKLTRSNTTWIREFTVQTGSVVSGSLRHLVLNDAKPLTLALTVDALPTSTMTVVGRTNRATKTALDIEAVGQLTHIGKGRLRMYARRWSDNQYVQVRVENIDQVKRRFRMTGLDSATYVRASDGRVEMRLTVERIGFSTNATRIQWDQALMTVR